MAIVKLNTIICIVYLFFLTNSQLSGCRGPQDLFKFQNFELQNEFDISFFLQDEYPDRRTIKNMFTVLGEGGFGSVIKVTLIDKAQDTPFDVALKVLKYKENQISRVDREIEVYKEMSIKHPLSAPIFFDCAHDAEKKVVFIITENLNGSMNSDEYVRLKSTHINHIQHLLLMARTLLDLHLMGYAHCDIKPDNFMFLKSNPIIIKLIDYGMPQEPGVVFGGGTLSFRDPMSFDTRIVSRKRDIYALGLTFFLVIHTQYFKHIKVSKKAEIETPEARSVFYAKRDAYLKEYFKTREPHLNTLEPLLRDAYLTINELIGKMVTNTYDDRIGLDEVIRILEEMLERLEPDSIYLGKNIDRLFHSVYPDSTFDYNRFIRGEISNEDLASPADNLHIINTHTAERSLPENHSTFSGLKRKNTYKEFDSTLKTEMRRVI